ncbi:MAG: MFS transporter, partial [Bdellovibrionota bacterium]
SIIKLLIIRLIRVDNSYFTTRSLMPKSPPQFESSCSSTPFRALLATQFFGAFNDNLFKTIISLQVLGKATTEENSILFLSLTAALFFLPYILFSALAGWISDQFSKSLVIVRTKQCEVVIMALGFLAFHYRSDIGLLLAVFLMGAQSALFSPSKLGIIPEMLSEEEISRANGFLKLVTFAAIICGTALAGVVLSGLIDNPGYICVSIALLGVFTSYKIASVRSVGAAEAFSFNPITPNLTNLKLLYQRKSLWLTVIGSAFFWSLGTLFQLNILLFAKEELQFTETATSILLAILGIGIGVGSVFAGKASEGKVELGLIPIGAFGIVLFSTLLAFSGNIPGLPHLAICLLGVSSGFFIVPQTAYLQEFSPPEKRGRFIAASNFFSNCCMFTSSILFWVYIDYLSFSGRELFLSMSFISLLVTIYLVRLLPETMTRCINWIALHCLYRIQKEGGQHIPKEGGALLVANHVTYVDALLLLAALPRPVRFIMYRPIYNSYPIHPIARLMKAIPISSSDGREQLEVTLRECGDLIERGELVGIFAEGALSRDGEMKTFKTGLETIMAGRTQPIIPIHLGGLWGSIFSHYGGKVFWKRPRKFPYPVTVTFGKPLPSSTGAADVEEAVRALQDEVALK